MKKPKGKLGTVVRLLLLGVFLASVVYNVYDNRRFKVVTQEIVIDRLPQSFDGFRILQISDLHGYTFGENQSRILDTINNLDFDMIALTGDMNARTTANTVEDSQAILDLLDGIERKAHLFWVDGNNAPHAAGTYYMGVMTGEITPIGALLQEKGCTILIEPAAITRGTDRIWITPDLSEAYFELFRGMIDRAEYLKELEDAELLQSYYPTAYAAFESIHGNGEVKIMLTHVPKPAHLTAGEREANGDLDYDLILAGHYHGGQIRLPLIGAIYIPTMVSGSDNPGFFPPQNEVNGISYYGDAPQYVSAGLGASSPARWLRFRLFNTPEINLITLKVK